MKRAQADDAGRSDRPKRRAKTSEACVACRKAKTRCEPAMDPSRGGCHRCSVLFVQCSFLDGTSPSAGSHIPSPASGDSFPVPSPGTVTSEASHSSLAHSPQISPFDATGITPEDLVCMPLANSASAHWSTAPMTAMQELIARPRRQQAPFNSGVPADEILDAGQIEYLLDIFETHYTPWLNIAYTYPSPTSPPSLNNLLTLARCAVTARHLPPESLSAVLPPLQNLVEHAVLVHMFNARKITSLEAVQALLILALWSPAVGPLSSDVQDGGLIVRSTVKMAISLGLDKSMDNLVAFRERMKMLGVMTPEDEQEHERLVYDSQVWSSICNVEWSLCLGTTRTPTSTPSKGMCEILNPRLFLGTATAEDIRTFRLRLTARLIEATHRGLSIKITDLKTFSSEMESVFNVFARARNCILPLQVTFPHERMHMDVVLLLAYWNVLLTFFHGLTQVRVYMETTHPDKPWLLALEDSNVSFVNRWGTMSVNAAQSVLITFFDIVDRCQASTSAGHPNPNAHGHFSPPLSTAPDSLFAAVLFAASAMLIVRYTVVRQYKRKRSITWFTTGALLAKLADTLDALAVSDEHAPRRAAAVVRELKRVWHEKVTSEVVVDGPTMGWLREPPEKLTFCKTPPIPQDKEAGPTTDGLPWSSNMPNFPKPPNPTQATFNEWAFDVVPPASQATGLPGQNFNMFAPSYLPYDFNTAASTAAAAAGSGAMGFEGFVDDDFWASFMGTLGAPGSF